MNDPRPPALGDEPTDERAAFDAVYESIDRLTTTHETAWLCWQAARVIPAVGAAAPAGEPAERRDAKQAVFEAAVVAHGVRFAVRKLRRPDIPSLEAIWVGVDEALAAPAALEAAVRGTR